jgi:hypothetical protein
MRPLLNLTSLLRRNSLGLNLMDSQISLAERYREVAKRDRKFEIFGARKHKYRPKKVSAGEIKEFELVIGCDLPEDYRKFLLRIGTGVGPYYGLWSFDNIRKELNSIYEDYQDEYNVRARPCDSFELEESAFLSESSEGKKAILIDAPKNPGGFLPICHQGCEYLNVMVLSGVLRGKVFGTSAFASTNAQWISATRPPGIVSPPRKYAQLPKLPKCPTFSEWFAGWTDNALRDLAMEGRD